MGAVLGHGRRSFECPAHRSNHFKPTVRPQGPTPCSDQEVTTRSWTGTIVYEGMSGSRDCADGILDGCKTGTDLYRLHSTFRAQKIGSAILPGGCRSDIPFALCLFYQELAKTRYGADETRVRVDLQDIPVDQVIHRDVFESIPRGNLLSGCISRSMTSRHRSSSRPSSGKDAMSPETRGRDRFISGLKRAR